jgi:site-specific recombinase XerD
MSFCNPSSDDVRADAANAPTRLKWLEAYLGERGHAAGTVRSYVRCAQHFEQWREASSKIDLMHLEADIQEFLREHLPTCTCSPPMPTHISSVRAALHHLVATLKRRGLKTGPPPALSPVDLELTAFDAFLVEACGVAEQTRIYRRRYVREFLLARFGTGPVEPKLLQPEELMRFVAGRAKGCKVGTAKVIASSLRSYLRFLAVTGRCRSGLVHAVPSMPQWRLSSLPKFLTETEAEALLGTFDRASASGCRDYAMTLCLLELGLRTQEVVGLQLDSLDWRNGTMLVAAGKSKRQRLLPLPRRVGDAIAAYLRQGRLASSGRSLFLRHTVPAGTPVTPGVVRRACARAGIAPPKAGPHALRHTAATRMVNHGVALGQIADLLGHASIETTAIYAKVNMTSLRQVAMPRPEA